MRKFFAILPFILLTALIAAIFCPLLFGDFLWDDQQFVLDNIYLRSFSSLPKLFTENIDAGAGIRSNMYRPLQLLTHFIDFQMWGTHPLGHRLTNVLLHLGAASAALLAVSRLVGLWPAFFAVSLYAIHPIQGETVGYISGRSDLLVLLFTCLGAMAFERRFGWALFCLLLALLSKESAIMLPVFVLGYDWMKNGKNIALKKHALLFSVAGAYIVLRLTVLNFGNTLNFYEQENVLTQNYIFRVWTFLSTLPKALLLILWPVDLHHERSWKVFTALKYPEVWTGALLLMAVLMTALWNRKHRPVLAFGLLWWLIAMAPTSNLFALINALFYDHWFILPSFGLFIALGSQISRMRWVPLASVWLLAVIPLTALTLEQVRIWSHPIPLYEHILKYEPRSPKILNNLAMYYDQEGRTEKAEQLYRDSISVDDHFPQTHHNLGMLYLKRNDPNKALEEYRKALALDPRFFASYTWMGHIYVMQGKRDEAIAAYSKALAIHPDPNAIAGLQRLR